MDQDDSPSYMSVAHSLKEFTDHTIDDYWPPICWKRHIPPLGDRGNYPCFPLCWVLGLGEAHVDDVKDTGHEDLGEFLDDSGGDVINTDCRVVRKFVEMSSKVVKISVLEAELLIKQVGVSLNISSCVRQRFLKIRIGS